MQNGVILSPVEIFVSGLWMLLLPVVHSYSFHLPKVGDAQVGMNLRVKRGQ